MKTFVIGDKVKAIGDERYAGKEFRLIAARWLNGYRTGGAVVTDEQKYYAATIDTVTGDISGLISHRSLDDALVSARLNAWVGEK
jgi:hypothetical protein